MKRIRDYHREVISLNKLAARLGVIPEKALEWVRGRDNKKGGIKYYASRDGKTVGILTPEAIWKKISLGKFLDKITHPEKSL